MLKIGTLLPVLYERFNQNKY